MHATILQTHVCLRFPSVSQRPRIKSEAWPLPAPVLPSQAIRSSASSYFMCCYIFLPVSMTDSHLGPHHLMTGPLWYLHNSFPLQTFSTPDHPANALFAIIPITPPEAYTFLFFSSCLNLNPKSKFYFKKLLRFFHIKTIFELFQIVLR